MDHVEYDVHQLQGFHNISCTWPPPMPPSQGDDFDSAPYLFFNYVHLSTYLCPMLIIYF